VSVDLHESGTPFVRVRDLTRSFGAVLAVDRVSWDVAPGELFGIVGPDGAGKTTILRMLSGVLRPTSGDAIIGSVSVARDPEGVKPRLAYMAQRFGLYEDLTVRENLDFYADLFRVPRAARAERLDRLYAFSRLGEFEHRLAGRLSGGMKQKLALSCSLIHQPPLLLLDEPTFGVDPISRRELWLILHEMVAEGVTVVVSTSYLDEAERCDRVALLDRGRLLALETPDALRRSFQGTLVSVRSTDARAIRNRLREEPDVASAVLFGDSVHAVLHPPLTAETLGVRLEAQGAGYVPPRPIEPSLEDVFLQLMRRSAAAGTEQQA
jgi:ABC-2 type transport system ATP-binding protein